MIPRLRLLISFALLLFALAACGGDEATPDASSDGTLSVVTTIGQIGDTARRVGGEHVTVTSLMGPGTDPHLYVASASDVDRLREADVVFYNGLFLEAQMEEILEQLGERQTVIPVTSTIDRAVLAPSSQYENEFDPHVWFDVGLWIETVNAVRDTLIEADPENSAAYEANAAEYIAELEQLDAYVREQAERVPADKRVLITAHDAFGYFGRAYGFDVMGLQGISTAAEASTADVQALSEFIASNEIPAIFVETSVPVRNIEAVQAAVRNRGFDVQIGGELYSDAMGPAGSGGDTYIGMVRHNIDTIVSALSGGQ